MIPTADDVENGRFGVGPLVHHPFVIEPKRNVAEVGGDLVASTVTGSLGCGPIVEFLAVDLDDQTSPHQKIDSTQPYDPYLGRHPDSQQPQAQPHHGLGTGFRRRIAVVEQTADTPGRSRKHVVEIAEFQQSEVEYRVAHDHDSLVVETLECVTQRSSHVVNSAAFGFRRTILAAESARIVPAMGGLAGTYVDLALMCRHPDPVVPKRR